jgi:hypothetical protein
MQTLNFGARNNSIIQFAYGRRHKRGNAALHGPVADRPMFLIGPFVPAKGIYLGAVIMMRISLAEPARATYSDGVPWQAPSYHGVMHAA